MHPHLLQHLLTPPLDPAGSHLRCANAHHPSPDHARLDSGGFDMTTSHRGLPPPASISLPDPQRAPPLVPLSSGGQLPPAPSQGHGTDDSMRNWLSARTEEHKCRQEQERSRQEELRLEQRRVEQSMLREALAGGVPAHLVPLIFAGVHGIAPAPADTDQLRQLAAQLQQQLSQVSQLPADTSNPHKQALAAQAAVYPSPAYQSPATKGAPGAVHYVPRNCSQGALPRLTTNEPSTGGFTQHEQQESSPSLYFHHWQPPQTQSTSKESTQKTSPNVPSRLAGDEMRNSPRKRKASGPHAAVSHPRGPSPAASTSSSTSSRGRAEQAARDAQPPREPRRAYDPLERDSRQPIHSSAPRDA